MSAKFDVNQYKLLFDRSVCYIIPIHRILASPNLSDRIKTHGSAVFSSERYVNMNARRNVPLLAGWLADTGEWHVI